MAISTIAMAPYIFIALTVVSFFLTALLSVFFFINKRGTIFENRLFALLLVVFNLQIFYSFATSYYGAGLFMAWHKPLFLVRQTSLLIGPLFFFYIQSFLKKKEGFRMDDSYHFLPFALVTLVLLFFYGGADRFVIWESKADLYTTLVILGQFMVYLVLALRAVLHDRQGVKGLWKKTDGFSPNRWLQILLSGFIFLWILNLNSFALYMILQRPGWCAYTGSIYVLAVFVFINAILLILLLNPEACFIPEKYKSSRLNEPDKAEYLHRLKEFMDKEKPYLNPDITLELLAAGTSIPPRVLSQIINETFGKNFKGFILEYRIRESMKILADERHARLTVLEILYQVGFNSKSAFNNQFKLYTNQTPLEYRSRAIRA